MRPEQIEAIIITVGATIVACVLFGGFHFIHPLF